MVMTFTLTPFSHYNSIIKPLARFLLSLLEDISIGFPSHFIISILDVYQDPATHDKLIFPSAIMRILQHFHIPIPLSPFFTTMGAISTGFVRWSEAKLRPKQPRMETDDPTTSAIPPSSLAPSPLQLVSLLMPSWSSCSECMLILVVVLTISLMRCVR